MNKLIELDIALKFATNMYQIYFGRSVDARNDFDEDLMLRCNSESSYWEKICNKIKTEMKEIIETNYPN
jgi:hypothetical protein